MIIFTSGKIHKYNMDLTIFRIKSLFLVRKRLCIIYQHFQTFQPDLKKPGQKFESECLIMRPNNNLFQTFCFQGELYLLCFFTEIKTKIQSFHFYSVKSLINSDIILQELRATFYFSVFKKKKQF